VAVLARGTRRTQQCAVAPVRGARLEVAVLPAVELARVQLPRR
jgi:hypothetical protein